MFKFEFKSAKMKVKMSGYVVFLIALLGLLIYIFVDTSSVERYIKDKGVEVSVTISMCKIERVGSGRNARNAWCSSGYYYVNGKEYRFGIEAVIPIGTKFMIKYDPRKPERSRLVNPHEFDSFPKTKSK